MWLGAGVFLIFFAFLFSSVEAASLEIAVSALEMPTPESIRLSLIFINPTPHAESRITITHSSKIELITAGKPWLCLTRADLTSCTIEARIVGSQKFSFDFALKQYFVVDYIDVVFEVPAAGERVERRIVAARPETRQLSLFFYTGLVSLAIGVLLATLLLIARGAPVVRRLRSALGALASALIAFGLAAWIVQELSIIFFTIAASSFLACFLAFSALAARALTREEIERERQRLNEMLRAARAKLMRREIDEATYNRIVQECELALLRLERAKE